MKTVPCCLLKTTAREMLKTIPISLSELEQAGSYCSISGSSTYVHCAAQYWAARERDEASSSPAMPKSNDNASDSTPLAYGCPHRQGRMAELLLPLLHGRAVAAVDAAYLIRLLPVSVAQRWPCYRLQCQRPLYDSVLLHLQKLQHYNRKTFTSLSR